MSSAKKSPIVLTPIRGVRRELEFLYARRYAIDSLIESLETYDRYRAKDIDGRKRKSA
jgi:hypothetical protein